MWFSYKLLGNGILNLNINLGAHVTDSKSHQNKQNSSRQLKMRNTSFLSKASKIKLYTNNNLKNTKQQHSVREKK